MNPYGMGDEFKPSDFNAYKKDGAHMYLAQNRINGKTRYAIRESDADGGILKSREVFDLGFRPDQYMIYPGGNAFYFHEEVYRQLEAKRVSPDEAALEEVFWPFLRQETRRKLRKTGFLLDPVMDGV